MGGGHISADEIYGPEESEEPEMTHIPAGNPTKAAEARRKKDEAAQEEKERRQNLLLDKIRNKLLKLDITNTKKNAKDVEKTQNKEYVKIIKARNIVLKSDLNHLRKNVKEVVKTQDMDYLDILKTRNKVIKPDTTYLKNAVKQTQAVMYPKGKGIGEGAKAGIVASGILLLAQAIQKMVKQSKIVNMVQEQIAKALGLLVDLILLPFLPLLVWGIINLYKAILLLGKLNPFSPDINPLNNPETRKEYPGAAAANDWGKEITGGLLDTTQLLALAGGVAVAIATALLVALGVATLWEVVAGLIIAGITAAIIAVIAPYAMMAGDAFASALRKFFDPIIRAGESFMMSIRQGWDQFWRDFDKAIQDFWKGVDEIITRVKGLSTFEWVTPWVDAVKSGIKAIGDAIGTLPKMFDEAIAAIKSGAKAIYNSFIGLINWILSGLRLVPIIKDKVPSDIPYLDTGGKIEKTGVAVVHKGETVVPAGQGGNTYYFYGYDDVSLQNKIKSLLRQEGTRYTI